MEDIKIKVHISDRSYTGWVFMDAEGNIDLSKESYPLLNKINPLERKMFSKDIFKVKDSPTGLTIESVYSYTRQSAKIAGVLMLENSKTFGRTKNKKRLLYKCIPDDTHMPAFLVPYDIKIGFSKVQKNKFVVFTFDSWLDTHPHGIICETIGDVDSLEAFYEYQLYCKSLHYSLSEFTNKTKASLNKKDNSEYIQQIFENPNFNIEDRRDKYIFTIDPTNSLDFDDGFGIDTFENERGVFIKVSIYIANVFVWLETLGLWNSFSQRVATIYLPDRRRPMLPTILSDALCSLQENQPRFALVMDFIIDSDGNVCDDYPLSYKNVLISVSKNYRYEDPKMINKDAMYKRLFEITNKMDNSVKNSHDVVAYWMVSMNSHTGVLMSNNKIGIFRAAFYVNSNSRPDIIPELNEETSRFIRNWNNTIGQYVLYSDDVSLAHELMTSHTKNASGMKSYIHITSPIRRLIDLLNQMILFRHFNIIKSMSTEASAFLTDWIDKMDYINTSMRSIRKVQSDCEILNRCFLQPDIMDVLHKGIVFDKIIKNDGVISYMVYLEKLKLLSKVVTELDVPNYSSVDFKLFLFEDEDKVKKKIRLQFM